MRVAIVFCLAVILCGPLVAQRNNWKPKDFEPLTELPWKDGKATMEQVVARIFRETNLDIRYPVLADYLRFIPVEDLGKAFDFAVALEGTQSPGNLVAFLLYIWAERDPVRAWERTKSLFDVVGIGHGWLGYDSWKSKIEVENHAAIQRSRFWLRNESTLVSFPSGCAASELPETERVRLMKLFTDEWFKRFSSWPGDRWHMEYPGAQKDETSDVFGAFTNDSEVLSPDSRSDGSRTARAACEVKWRRWLVKHPKRASKVIFTIERTTFALASGSMPDLRERAEISTELLLVWRKVDADSLKAWASAPPPEAHRKAALTARCILITEVEPELRQKWLKEMLSGDNAVDNIEVLAAWEPQLAMESASMVMSEWLELSHLLDRCARPFRGGTWNASHSGFGYLMEHGLEHLAPSLRKLFEFGLFECRFMELWGDIDVGETARFGLRTMLTDKSVPRQELIDMYEGRENGDRDDNLVDRTFCALRVWAVVRPDEMREWIKTVDGADMRKALTWMLEHPWGTGESDER